MAENNTKDLESHGERLSADEQNVARLLGGLKRVEAPKDFDLRLNARIANASPAVRPAWRLIPVLKYALPAIVVFAIAGVMVFRNFSVPGDISTASERSKPVVDAPPPAVVRVETPLVENGRDTTLAKSETPARVTEPSPVNVARTDRRPRVTPVRTATVPLPTPRMSEDKALTGSNVIITPPDLNTKGTQVKPDDFDTSAPISVRQVLSVLDIDAEFDGTAWKVSSVKKGGFGERSGVQAGDQIEEIDSRKIEENTTYKGSVSAKSIKVRRGDKVVNIELRYR